MRLRDLGCAFAWMVLAGCGGRPSYWDDPVPATSVTPYGLTNGVALVDDEAHRVVILTAGADQDLTKVALPVGHHVTSATPSPDGRALFVLSSGDFPRRTAADEPASLTVVDVSNFAPARARYEMPEALANLAIDPRGQWAVAYAGKGSATSFVQNPNELVIVDLRKPGTTPTPVTLRSFGGTPQRLTFTPPLRLASGQRRLLVVETDIDVTLVVLDGPTMPPPQVTVRLTSGTTARSVAPAGVVVDGFDPNEPNDARIALRAADDRNVYAFTLGPPADPKQEFTPTINLTDVGGVPSDLAFVRTDAGLRIAALVPSTTSAVLVDPDTSVTTPVSLPAPYASLSLVTSVVGSGTGTDVAMLWNARANSSNVGLWTLGDTVGKAYASVEALDVTAPISAALDVGAPNQRLKVLEMSDGSGFFVLDLDSRMAAPLQTQGAAALSIAPDGERLWAYAPEGTRLAAIDFATLSPVLLTTDPPIHAAYDIARPPDGAERSLVAIHAEGAVGATVFDARHPDMATARRVSSLLLEGP